MMLINIFLGMHSAKRSAVSDAAKEKLRPQFEKEYELYEFCVSRLKKQLQEIRH